MRYYGIQNEVKSYLNRLQSEEGIEVSPSTVKTLNDRVESLKKSGIWSQYGLGFNDRDADSYFQRATVRDAIGRFEVCLFVRGIKTLGLWQNMVSWPMRSYQNAGTGSTVYSLGGFQISNGTMVNSPTWQQNGIYFIPNSYINAINYANYPYNTGQFGISVFSVVNPLGWLPDGTTRTINLLGLPGAGSPILHLTTGVGGGNTMWLEQSRINFNDASLGASYVNNYIRSYGSPSVNTAYFKNNFFYAGYSPGTTVQNCLFVVDSSSTLNGNSYTVASSFGITPSSSTQLRVGSTNVNTTALIPITTLFSSPINLEQHQLLRQLYKLTLGSNLGLP